jgi:hypothetical protein
LISDLPSHRHERLIATLSDGSLPHLALDVERLEGWLEERVPRAILVGSSEELLRQVADTVRASSSLSMVPIIWLPEQVDALSFERAYATGADDVANGGLGEDVIRRLLSVPEEPKVPEGPGGARCWWSTRTTGGVDCWAAPCTTRNSR